MVEDIIADPGQRANYQALRQKYGGWQYSNFEDSIKKITRPSELDEIRMASKYFLSSGDAVKLGDAINHRLNELSDKLISFGDFMRAYKNAESGFMAMRDRCVKEGNDWVCASYTAQVEYFIDSQAKDSSTGGRGPLNDMLGKVREGYEITKIIEDKWKEYKEKGEKEKLPGYEEEEIKDIFKGLLAKQIGIDRFWAVMDIRSEVEGKPVITPTKKKELIDLWMKHGIMLPAQKHITKPEISIPTAPTAPVEPIPVEKMRQVIKKGEEIDKRLEELRKKKELEMQKEKEREKGKPPALPTPTPPKPVVVPSELDLMKDDIEKRIAAEIKRRKAAMTEGQAGEPAAGYGKKKDLSRTTLLEVTGTESRYSGSQWIKTPVSISIEKEPNAHYLLYRKGVGKERRTIYHAKTYGLIYAERYQAPFGYTVELRFTDEKNNIIKAIFDPAPNNIINGVVLENDYKIAGFEVDEASFRKAEQFTRENKVVKETGSGYIGGSAFVKMPTGYFVWTKGLGQRHYAHDYMSETLCGMPMSGNNYAKIIPESQQKECEKCAEIAETVAATALALTTAGHCPRCGTRFSPKPGGASCPKCGTFIPERLPEEPEILPDKSYSYAELQFRIKTCYDVDTLKKVHAKIDTTDFTEFDKEMLKEELSQRMQAILEHEESGKPGAGAKFAEGAAEYIIYEKNSKTPLIDQLLNIQSGKIIILEYKDLPEKNAEKLKLPGYKTDVWGTVIERRGNLIAVGTLAGAAVNSRLYLQKHDLIPIRPIPHQKILKQSGEYVNTAEYVKWVERMKKEAPEYLPVWELNIEKKRLDFEVTKVKESDAKTPLQIIRDKRLKEYPTEESFRKAKTNYADFLESDFHLKSHKTKAEEYKPGTIQYNKHMAVYNERLKEIADLRKEAAAGKTILELELEEVERQSREYEAEIEAHQQKLKTLTTESYESLLSKAKSFNAIWGDESKAWKDRYKAKDEVKDIISVLKERKIDIIPALNEQLHELQAKNKNKTKEPVEDYMPVEIGMSTSQKYAKIFGLPVEDIAHADYNIFTGTLTVTYGIDKPRHKQKKVTRKASKEFADFFTAPIFIGKSVDYILAAYLKEKGTNQVIEGGLFGSDQGKSKWEDYLIEQKAEPKKLDLSGSVTRKRYQGIVMPVIEHLTIDDVLNRVDINYTPEEYPQEQAYIDNRLIPHMKTTKLPFPVIEIYTHDQVDNQRPMLPSGKRPFTDIHILDGAHRIVALKKLGITKIPFIVYKEPVPELKSEDLQRIYDQGKEDVVKKLGSDINDYTKVVYGLEAVLRYRGMQTKWDDISHWWHMPLAMIPSSKPLSFVAKSMEGEMERYVQADSYETTNAISAQNISWRTGRIESAMSHDPKTDVEGILEYNIRGKHPSIRKNSKEWKEEVRKIGDKALQLAIKNKEAKIAEETSSLKNYYDTDAKKAIEKAMDIAKSLEYRADVIQALIPESSSIKKARDVAFEIRKRAQQYDGYFKKYLSKSVSTNTIAEKIGVIQNSLNITFDKDSIDEMKKLMDKSNDKTHLEYGGILCEDAEGIVHLKSLESTGGKDLYYVKGGGKCLDGMKKIGTFHTHPEVLYGEMLRPSLGDLPNNEDIMCVGHKFEYAHDSSILRPHDCLLRPYNIFCIKLKKGQKDSATRSNDLIELSLLHSRLTESTMYKYLGIGYGEYKKRLWEYINKYFDKQVLWENVRQEDIERISVHEQGSPYLIEDPADIGDPDVWIKSKGASFHDEVRGAHHGQVDGTLSAYDTKTSETIGHIDYSIFEGKLYLDGIEVESAHRRHGYATALLMKLNKLNPGMAIKWEMMTEEGCALKCATDKIMERSETKSVDAFLAYHHTGDIPTEVYHYNTIESLSWLRSEEHKIVVKTISTGKGKIELRKSDEKLQYVRHDADGEISRDPKTDMALYLSDEEIVAKGLPKTDTTIVAFNEKNQAVGFASNEFGADGVWVVDEYQKQGIGTSLLSELRAQFTPGRKIGQMTESGYAMAKAYYRQIQKEIQEPATVVRESDTRQRSDIAKLSKQDIMFQIRAYRKSGKTKEELERMTREQLIDLWMRSPRDEGYVAESGRDDVENGKEDCKDWTFGDYEVMLEGVESPDDLEELLDCVASSDKLTDPEIETLKKLIENKRMEE